VPSAYLRSHVPLQKREGARRRESGHAREGRRREGEIALSKSAPLGRMVFPPTDLQREDTYLRTHTVQKENSQRLVLNTVSAPGFVVKAMPVGYFVVCSQSCHPHLNTSSLSSIIVDCTVCTARVRQEDDKRQGHGKYIESIFFFNLKVFIKE